MDIVGNSGGAAQFLQLASEDADIRQTLSSAIKSSRQAEAAVVERAVELAKKRGINITAGDLRQELESQLGLKEVEIGEASALPPCNSKSGCRTPCVYCNAAEA